MAEQPTAAEIASWPPTVSVRDACRALGISKSAGYDAITRGQFPVRVIRAGSRLLVVTADLARVLGIGWPGPEAAR